MKRKCIGIIEPIWRWHFCFLKQLRVKRFGLRLYLILYYYFFSASFIQLKFHIFALLFLAFLPLGHNVDSDVAIIKLSSPLTFNSDVRPACLPSQDFYPENEGKYNAITSGWGMLKDRKCIFWLT